MNNILILILVNLFSFSETSQKSWVLSNESFIEIKGLTNISKFNCEIKHWQATESNKLLLNPTNGKFDINNNQLTLNICSIDCGNAVMNEDLAICLNAEQHPDIKLKINHFKGELESGNLQLNVDIDLSGKTKNYNIFCGASLLEKSYLINGCEKILLSDFGLTPPSKIFGLVQVSNEIEINFSFYFINASNSQTTQEP